jgi:hypothetical protein
MVPVDTGIYSPFDEEHTTETVGGGYFLRGVSLLISRQNGLKFGQKITNVLPGARGEKVKTAR